MLVGSDHVLILGFILLNRVCLFCFVFVLFCFVLFYFFLCFCFYRVESMEVYMYVQ